MDFAAVQNDLVSLIGSLAFVGRPIQALLPALSLVLVATAVLPHLRRGLPHVLMAMALLLAVGEGALAWFHVRLYQLCAVLSPETGQITGRIAVPLWVESEKLYIWALIVAVMGVLLRRHREELLPGVAIAVAVLATAAALWARPFTEPLPQFFGQYSGYLQAMGSGIPQAALGAYQGMEGSRQYFYNSWYMWVHPPLLFLSYGAFTVSFVAAIWMIRTRFSAFEETAYRWARFGYLPLTTGMLLGFPWAILAWSGESWWWSGKVNMSIMMWFLYTAYLHGRLYLRRRGMWRWVAALAVLSFAVLVLTYVATYVVPGAHSYAFALPAEEVAAWTASC